MVSMSVHVMPFVIASSCCEILHLHMLSWPVAGGYHVANARSVLAGWLVC